MSQENLAGRSDARFQSMQSLVKRSMAFDEMTPYKNCSMTSLVTGEQHLTPGSGRSSKMTDHSPNRVLQLIDQKRREAATDAIVFKTRQYE